MTHRRERRFEVELPEPGDFLRLHVDTEGGQVVAFLAQYEVTIAGERVPVTRYDSRHGRPHQDVLDRRGNVVAKRWLDAPTYADALNEGERDLRANWRRYKADFLRRNQ